MDLCLPATRSRRQGRRLPQRTMNLGDLTTLTPGEARTAAEAAKAAVRNGRTLPPSGERHSTPNGSPGYGK